MLATTRVPLVVGIYHGDNGGLVDAYGQERFAAEIAPLIHERTLLVLEGRYNYPIYYAGGKKHAWHRKLANKWLGITIPKHCSFAFRDRRFSPPHRGVADIYFKAWRLEKLQKIRQPRLSCTSLRSLVRRVAKGLKPHLPKNDIPSELKMLLWNHGKEVKEFFNPTVAVAKKHMNTHDVIIVCGAGHALHIHKTLGWELKLLVPDTPDDATLIIREYHRGYILPMYFQPW